MVPNMIEIGGVHIDRNIKPLPEVRILQTTGFKTYLFEISKQDIQSFLDTASNGAIYVSFGTVLRGAALPLSKREALIKVFGSLKQKVIWKFDDITIMDLPSNVLMKTWLPQNSIFAHPNTKLFISHCGQLGSIEAAYAGLPIIGIPFFGDQHRNINGFVESGWALKMDYDNITAGSLSWAIHTVLGNKR